MPKDEKALKLVLDAFNAWESFDATHKEKRQKWYEQYRSILADAEQRLSLGKSALFIPETFINIETIAPRLVEALFATRPYIGVLAHGEHNADRIPAVQNFMTYQFDRMDLPIKFIEFIKDYLLYGVAVGEVGWRFETRKVIRKKPVTILGQTVGYEEEETDMVIYDDPTFELVDLDNFIFDPKATNLQDGRYYGTRKRMTKSDLKWLEDLGVFRGVSRVKEGNQSTEPPSKSVVLGNSSAATGYDSNDPRFEVIELYFPSQDRVITVAERQWVLRDGPIPYWFKSHPYVMAKNHLVPHEFYAIGDIEPTEALQEELNTIHNQRIDNVSLVINRMWKVLRGANVDYDELVSRRGGIVNVDRMDDVEPFEMPEVTGSAFTQARDIERLMKDVSGTQDIVRGAEAVQRQTATEITSLENSATFRFRFKIRVLETMALRQIARLVYAFDQQFLDTGRVVKVVGPDGAMVDVTIGPEDFQMDADFVFIGAAVEPEADKNIRRNQLINFFNILQAGPAIQAVNLPEFIKLILQEHGIKNAERLIASAPPQMPAAPGQPGNLPMPPPPLTPNGPVINGLAAPEEVTPLGQGQ